MLKKALLVLLAVAVVAAVIFWAVKLRRPSVSEARADFCVDLLEYGQAIVNFRSIDQNSTVEELVDAHAAVQESWENLQQSSAALNEARIDDLESAYADLERTIQSIPNDRSLAEAQTEIYLAALNTLARALTIDQVTCKFTLDNPRDSAGLQP